MRKYFAIVLTAISMLPSALFAQEVLVDQVIAVVGGNAIYRSDIENQYMQMRAQGTRDNGSLHCRIFSDLLQQKLLLHQARIDSIEVTDSQVENQLDQRLDYFIRQIGSKEKLEEYFKKSIFEIKDDFRESIREQILTTKMQGNITENVRITPSEVKKYYNSLSRDSIPQVNSQVELEQILVYPRYSQQAIFDVKEKLLGFRKRIMDGEKFSTLAVLYSEDPGSATKGGEIGFMSKAELDPEYAKAAYSLKVGAISTIVESQFGYHIIQLIDRQEERVNTRHILLKPKADPEALSKAKLRIDSIAMFIQRDSFTFEKGALMYSEDKDTHMNEGLVINKNTASSKFELGEFQQTDYVIIKDLKVGEISKPYQSIDDKGKPVYKMIRLKSKTSPHRANLTDDYQLLTDKALEDKKKAVIADWIKEKRKKTFLQVTPAYSDCSFYKDWTNDNK
jgi:peptidyl-prolyl cis-trans isomerase SurA